MLRRSFLLLFVVSVWCVPASAWAQFETAAVVGTVRDASGAVVAHVSITNLDTALPLNGREYSQLALLSPGVRQSALNTGGFTPREGSLNVNGCARPSTTSSSTASTTTPTGRAIRASRTR